MWTVTPFMVLNVFTRVHVATQSASRCLGPLLSVSTENISRESIGAEFTLSSLRTLAFVHRDVVRLVWLVTEGASFCIVIAVCLMSFNLTLFLLLATESALLSLWALSFMLWDAFFLVWLLTEVAVLHSIFALSFVPFKVGARLLFETDAAIDGLRTLTLVSWDVSKPVRLFAEVAVLWPLGAVSLMGVELRNRLLSLAEATGSSAALSAMRSRVFALYTVFADGAVVVWQILRRRVLFKRWLVDGLNWVLAVRNVDIQQREARV